MIYLVENNNQVDLLVKKKFDKNKLHIAFTPDIFVKLKENNFKVLKVNKFFKPEDHLSVSQSSHEYCNKVCSFLNHNSYFKTDSALITFRFYLKLYLSHVFMIIIVYKNLKKEYPNDKINDLKSNETTNINFSEQPILRDDDSFFKGMFNKHTNAFKSTGNYILFHKAIKLINKYKILKYQNTPLILTTFQNGNMRKYLEYLYEQKSFKKLRFRSISKNIFLEILYSLYCLIKRIPIVTVPSTVDEKQVNNIFMDLEKSNILKFESFEIFKIMDRKLYQLIGHTLFVENSLANTKEYLCMLNDVRVLSISSLGFSSALAEVASSLGITSTLVSHGSHIKHDGLTGIEQDYLALGQIDTPCYSNVVVQSPYAYEFIKSRRNNVFKSKPIMWGDSFDKSFLVDNKGNNQLICLHASTPKSLIRPIIFETSFEYIENIINIAKAIHGVENIRYIVRFRKVDTISLNTIKHILKDYTNIEIATDKTFQYYLNKADILLSYSSTTIEESMLKDKKIILFGNNGIYEHIKFIEGSNICFVENQKELRSVLKQYINGKKNIAYKTYKDMPLYILE